MPESISGKLFSGWNVLVVDDDESSLETLSRLLRSAGANVYMASNGQEALEIVKTLTPRFILTDLNMPLLDGWELVAELKRSPNTEAIPIFALVTSQDDYGRICNAGFDNCISKPIISKTFMHDLLSLL